MHGPLGYTRSLKYKAISNLKRVFGISRVSLFRDHKGLNLGLHIRMLIYMFQGL